MYHTILSTFQDGGGKLDIATKMFVQQQLRFTVNFVLPTVQNLMKKHMHLNIISTKDTNMKLFCAFCSNTTK